MAGWFWVVSCRLESFQLARQYSFSALDASRCQFGELVGWLVGFELSVVVWWVFSWPDNILSLRSMPQDSRCQFGDLCRGPQAALHLAGPWVTSRSSSATCFPGFEQSRERGNQACFYSLSVLETLAGQDGIFAQVQLGWEGTQIITISHFKSATWRHYVHSLPSAQDLMSRASQ